MEMNLLVKKSIEYRQRVLKLIKKAGAGHTGGDLSCIDILNVLYNEILNVSPNNFSDSNRDRYIHSKGHSVESLYVVLADKGFLNDDQLNTLGMYKSPLIGHPTRDVSGIEQNTGALGHGLSVSVGLAIAAKLDDKSYRVYTLIGDGELSEGSNWEAAMSAAHYKLDNLIVIIDRNKLQITGPTEQIMGLEPLQAKFEAFGFSVKHVDGNNIPALVSVLRQTPFQQAKPSLIIADTTKGKGVSFMENQTSWHHRVPTDTELIDALNELSNAYAQVENNNE
jgi:transketolase